MTLFYRVCLESQWPLTLKFFLTPNYLKPDTVCPHRVQAHTQLSKVTFKATFERRLMGVNTLCSTSHLQTSVFLLCIFILTTVSYMSGFSGPCVDAGEMSSCLLTVLDSQNGNPLGAVGLIVKDETPVVVTSRSSVVYPYSAATATSLNGRNEDDVNISFLAFLNGR